MMRSVLLFTAILSFSSAFSTRRDILQKACAIATASPVIAAQAAVDACPPKSNNCLRTTWTAPGKVTASEVLEILNSYPQEGQNKADLGGWSLVTNDLTGSTKSARLEYQSGIGNFAKFLNGGKPFVDDLFVEITGDSTVEFKSASRVGDSDFGVNQKRMRFLAEQARAKGWTAPDPVY